MSGPIRAWSPTHGLGDLDWKVGRCAFTPDDKAKSVITFRWVEVATGKPGKRPRRKAEEAEWKEWLRFTTPDGEVHVYRRNSAPARTP